MQIYGHTLRILLRLATLLLCFWGEPKEEGREEKKGTWDSSSRPWRVGGKLLLPPPEELVVAGWLFFLSSTEAVIYNWGASFHRHDDSTAIQNAAPSVVVGVQYWFWQQQRDGQAQRWRPWCYISTTAYTYIRLFLRWHGSTVNTIAAAKHILPAVVLLKHNKEAIKGYCFFSAPLRTRGKILASMRSFFIPRLSKKTFELKLNNATVAISHSTKPKKKTSSAKAKRGERNKRVE